MKRKVCKLIPKATKRRIAYSLAAGAAFAATNDQGANAEVVHVIPADGVVPLTGPPGYVTTSFDLDGDMSSDVIFKNYAWPGGPYQGLSVLCCGQVAGFNAGPNGFAYVSNLAPGTMIDSSSVGPTFFGSMSYGAANPNAQFNTGGDGYIGLSFGPAAELRYGWIRVSLNNATGSLRLQDWAYESTPFTGIKVGAIPEPGTLGILAAGALGVAALRRRRTQSA